MDKYRAELRDLKTSKLQLANMDFDTGKPTGPGEYRLTDETYAKLLDKLAKEKFGGMLPDLRENILAFYQNPSAPNFTKKKRDKWNKVQAAVGTENSLQRKQQHRPAHGHKCARLIAVRLIEE